MRFLTSRHAQYKWSVEQREYLGALGKVEWLRTVHKHVFRVTARNNEEGCLFMTKQLDAPSQSCLCKYNNEYLKKKCALSLDDGVLGFYTLIGMVYLWCGESQFLSRLCMEDIMKHIVMFLACQAAQLNSRQLNSRQLNLSVGGGGAGSSSARRYQSLRTPRVTSSNVPCQSTTKQSRIAPPRPPRCPQLPKPPPMPRCQTPQSLHQYKIAFRNEYCKQFEVYKKQWHLYYARQENAPVASYKKHCKRHEKLLLVFEKRINHHACL